MEVNKVRELGEAELREEMRRAAEQLFRIRFQMKLGQQEGVKRLQVLRKDIARFKTIDRERALGIRGSDTDSVIGGKKGRNQLGTGEVS